jgi:DNA polymerase-3 subunit epsilon
MTIVFDTETTGKANFKRPADDPSQPRIVQLGAILYDEEKRVVAEMNLLVKPDGWAIPKEASDIHGITTERAERYGLPIKTVIMLFIVLCRRAQLSVAHNRPFDKLMVEAELIRLGFTKELEEWRAMAGFCTMEATTPILRLPGPYGFKWPKLQEAYVHFFGEEFDGAHDAMADVRACGRVYYAVGEMQQKAAA